VGEIGVYVLGHSRKTSELTRALGWCGGFLALELVDIKGATPKESIIAEPCNFAGIWKDGAW
jgi:hypothetical protein